MITNYGPDGAEGALVYDETANVLKLCDGTTWQTVVSGGGGASQWTTGAGGLIYYNAGNVGIGTATPSQTLDVSGRFRTTSTSTASTGWNNLNQVASTVSTTTNGDAAHVSLGSSLTYNGSASLTERQIGLTGGVTHSGTGALTMIQGVAGSATTSGAGLTTTGQGGSFFSSTGANAVAISNVGAIGAVYFGASSTTTNALALQARVAGSSTGAVVTNAYGLQVLWDPQSGTMTNGYGVYIDNVEATTDFAVYQVGASDENYFAGNVGIGTTAPQSALHVPDGKYAQFEDFNAGAPAAADCDADTERGRMSIDTTNFRLYICMGATRGWDYSTLNN